MTCRSWLKTDPIAHWFYNKRADGVLFSSEDQE